MFQHRIAARFFQTLDHCAYGRLEVVTPDGQRRQFEGRHAGAQAQFVIRDWRAVAALAARGDIGMAEAYREGWWDSADLAALLQFGLDNEAALRPYIYGNVFSRLASRFFYLFARNTLKGSRRNIHAHYDLGNAFYSLWLDPGMTYSSALFKQGDENLQTAQDIKYDRMIERLNASSGRLLEIGCGWGGLAERALTRHDFAIKGITLSSEQYDYATKRVGDRADIALEDYRMQEGKYDHILSIEMFEAVGESFWPVYFDKIKSLLEVKGRALIQTITIREECFEAYRAGGDAIRTFIFPGGMLPSPERFERGAAQAGLRLTDRFAFGRDYARTLEQWLANFEARLGEVRQLGFDEPFIRIWRFYLAACIASFRNGRTDVMQMELQHA